MEIGNELDMWTNLLNKFESELNIKAEEEWATPEKISVDEFSYSPPKQIKVTSADVTLNHEALKKGIEKASGPHNLKSESTGGNRYWPGHNDSWVHEFVPHMTTAITDVIDTALAEAKINLLIFQSPYKNCLLL
jgi:hypothetical protein